MSGGGAFGGARGLPAKAPEKGVFPLDHFGECKQVKDDYLQCLKEHSAVAHECLHMAKAYLNCRMDRGLMAQHELKDLGLGESAFQSPPPKAASDRRAKKGFVAGMQT